MHKDNIRITKTDKVDTFIIAKTLLMQNPFGFVSFYDLELLDLKLLACFRQKTIKQRTLLKIQLTSYVNQGLSRTTVFLQIQSESESCLSNSAVCTHLLLRHQLRIFLPNRKSITDTRLFHFAILCKHIFSMRIMQTMMLYLYIDALMRNPNYIGKRYIFLWLRFWFESTVQFLYLTKQGFQNSLYNS